MTRMCIHVTGWEPISGYQQSAWCRRSCSVAQIVTESCAPIDGNEAICLLNCAETGARPSQRKAGLEEALFNLPRC
jgi:hypothetical protein